MYALKRSQFILLNDKTACSKVFILFKSSRCRTVEKLLYEKIEYKISTFQVSPSFTTQRLQLI